MAVSYTQPTELLLLDPKVLANDLADAVDRALPDLRALGELESAESLAEGKWSPREVLGHLVDSACNNHQRFVRLQIDPELRMPGYKQAEWVAVQGYADRPWQELVTLWEVLNRHLVHVVMQISRAHLGREWVTDDGEHTLGFLIEDYTAHMTHHLHQVLGSRG